MKHIIDELYDLKEAVSYEIGEANKRIRNGGGKISVSDLDIIDKLTHAMKSIVTTCAMLESEEGGYSGNYPMYGRSYRDSERREGYSGRRYYGRPDDMRDDMDRMGGQR